MPRRISDYPDAFAGWNYVSSFGSIISVVATGLFLHLTYLQLTVGKAVSRYPWTTPQFFSDLLQTLLNRSYTSLEWALTSPPAPHAFVSLPLQSRLNVNTKFAIFSISIAILMIFLYKLPFKFLLTCLNLIYLYPIMSTILIIVTIIIKRFSYGQDIQRKQFFLPIITYWSISGLLHIVGRYIESDDVMIILINIIHNLHLLYIGYISVEDILKPYIIHKFYREIILSMSDRNSPSNAVTIYRPGSSGTPGNCSPSSSGPLTNHPSGSIGISRPGSPSSLQRLALQNERLEAARIERLMKNQLINLKSKEGVETPYGKLLYDEVKLAFFKYNNFDKTLQCKPWGDHIWEADRKGESFEHEGALLDIIWTEMRDRTFGSERRRYPILSMSTVSYESIYGLHRFTGLDQISSDRFKEEYMMVISVKMNAFLLNIDTYEGSHQPMAKYIAGKLDKANGIFSENLGMLERIYTLELFIKFLKGEGKNKEASRYINTVEFRNYLRKLA